MDGLKVYVDASVVLRRLLGAPGAITNWSAWELGVASELMAVEALRTLDRLRVMGELTASQLADCIEELKLCTLGFEEVPVGRPVLKRAAASLPVPLGTLDAIHLATAQVWMENNSQELIFLTHDRQLAIAVRACGLEVKTSL